MEQTTIIGFIGNDAQGKMNEEKGFYNLWLSVAVTRKFTQNGQEVKRTNWYRVFKKYREEPKRLLELLKKGEKVYVQGEPSYQVKSHEGNVSIETVLSANELFPLTFKNDENGN